jgi:hypothetical protein
MWLSSSMRSAGVNFLGGPTSGEDDAFVLSSSDIAQNAAMLWKGARTKLVWSCSRTKQWDVTWGRLPEV